MIRRLRELHERAKKGPLGPADKGEYEQHRRELERVMLLAQNMDQSGEPLRGGLRIAQIVNVELDLGGGSPERAATVDIASGGFAVFLSHAQPVGRTTPFTLMLPSSGSGPQPVKGVARVASSKFSGTAHRVSFSIEKIEPDERERLESVLIDLILARFTTPA